MTKKSILILDCTPKGDPSEGLLLKEFFKMCKLHKPVSASALHYKVKSKTGFLNKLKTRKRYDIIHISAHGPPENEAGISNGRTWVARPEEIERARRNRRATLVLANACFANRRTIADAFNSDYFLAPKTDVLWVDAALFSVMFYKRYIVDGIEIGNAFNFARKRTQTSKDYPVYWELTR